MSKAGKIALGIIVALAVAFCIGSYALDRHLLGTTYARYVPNDVSLMLTDEEIATEYPSEAVEFKMDAGTLRGRVYKADSPRGLVVFRHGIFSQHQDYLALITSLVDRGWNVFAYDAIGCGLSDGDSVIGFAQSPLDVRAAVAFAYDSGMAGDLPVVLVGHSWGGYGVAGALDFADVRDRVSACVTMSGFDTPDDIIMESAAKQMGPVASTQKPFIDLIGFMDFGADAGRSAAQAIGSCEVPTLIIHGTGDAVISYEGASVIAETGGMANPHVSTSTVDESGRNGHNSYFYSPESQAYLAECAEGLARLTDEYGDDIPADKLDAFMRSVDKQRANTADPVLMDRIDGFLSEATGR